MIMFISGGVLVSFSGLLRDLRRACMGVCVWVLAHILSFTIAFHMVAVDIVLLVFLVSFQRCRIVILDGKRKCQLTQE